MFKPGDFVCVVNGEEEGLIGMVLEVKEETLVTDTGNFDMSDVICVKNSFGLINDESSFQFTIDEFVIKDGDEERFFIIDKGFEAIKNGKGKITNKYGNKMSFNGDTVVIKQNGKTMKFRAKKGELKPMLERAFTVLNGPQSHDVYPYN